MQPKPLLWLTEQSGTAAVERREPAFFKFGDFPVEHTGWNLERRLNTALVALVADAIDEQLLHLPAFSVNLKIHRLQITNSFALFYLAEPEQILQSIVFHRQLLDRTSLQTLKSSLSAIKITFVPAKVDRRHPEVVGSVLGSESNWSRTHQAETLLPFHGRCQEQIDPETQGIDVISKEHLNGAIYFNNRSQA